MSEGESSMPSLDDILRGDAVGVAADDKVAESKPQKEKSKKSKDVKNQSSNLASVNLSDPVSYVVSCSEAVCEQEMASWAIDILVDSILAIKYRQVFRAAAQQKGEAAVYSLLRVMLKNVTKTKWNQLWMAAHPAVSAARCAGKGIPLPEGMQPADAASACRAILDSCKQVGDHGLRTFSGFYSVPNE